METKKLSLEEWGEYAKKGADIPITVPLHGSSMEPLIRYMKDPVTIVPLKRDPLVGDIVMFRRSDGAYVAHRVYKVTANKIITWGDNCVRPDAPLLRKDVIGLIISMERNGKKHLLDTDKQRAYGIRWMTFYRRLWRIYINLRHVAGRVIRFLLPEYHKKSSN